MATPILFLNRILVKAPPTSFTTDSGHDRVTTELGELPRVLGSLARALGRLPRALGSLQRALGSFRELSDVIRGFSDDVVCRVDSRCAVVLALHGQF